MWILFAFLSAALLGVYDVFKKISLSDNAVIPVLFLNVVFCCAIFLPLMVLSFAAPELTAGTIFHMPPLTLRQHALLLLKATIVLSSWMTAYYALKHLPITIASPIKATQPILTLVGALVVFGERLNLYQWIGVAIAIVSFFMLSQSSKREGVNFAHNRWVWLMVCSIVMGTVSGLYDKWIMTHIDRMNTQVWYNYYQLLIMCVVLLAVWYPKRRQTTPFRWSWAIPLISVFLTAADFFYYFALADGASMIAIVSLVRRSSVAVSFTLGALYFKERNLRAKAIDLLLVLLGMLFIFLGSQ
ncbi:MAG: DMT family transporter [Paludibacteraceae bacterium]|nr:DMT family transporter [Paludibacteraceae bacterium]